MKNPFFHEQETLENRQKNMIGPITCDLLLKQSECAGFLLGKKDKKNNMHQRFTDPTHSYFAKGYVSGYTR
jgi:hypothetical protein